jgi:hypothetical protein
VKRSLPFWALAATLFAIRWWVLGGIGGYVDQRSGKAEVFQLGVLAAAKAAALRIWSALYFPINWSVTISWLRPPGSPERRPDRVDTLDHLA